MFRSLSFEGEKVKKNKLPVIKLKKQPYSLGNYTDINGVVWDINAIVYGVVFARQISMYPNYYSTALWSSQDGVNEWKAHRVEVVN